MKKIWQPLLLSLTLLISSLAAARPLVVISDMDDTIKISHVLSWTSSIGNVFRGTDNAFWGMNSLYQELKETYGDDIAFYYVSNAPTFPVGSFHKRFLIANKFPKNALYTRDDIFSKTHKVDTIRRILKKETPEKVILIGDNGERDTLIYDSVVKNPEYTGISFTTFIHQTYSVANTKETGKELLENQIGFVTPIEIALELNKDQIIKTESLGTLWKKIVYPVYLDREASRRFIPSWVDCRDFKWYWDGTGLQLNNINNFRDYVIQKCNRKD